MAHDGGKTAIAIMLCHNNFYVVALVRNTGVFIAFMVEEKKKKQLWAHLHMVESSLFCTLQQPMSNNNTHSQEDAKYMAVTGPSHMTLLVLIGSHNLTMGSILLMLPRGTTQLVLMTKRGFPSLSFVTNPNLPYAATIIHN